MLCAPVHPNKHTPWFSSIFLELYKAKVENQQAEGLWCKSGLNNHQQMLNAAKTAVTKHVYSSKTAFFQAQIIACGSSMRLFKVCSYLSWHTNVSQVVLTIFLPTTYLGFSARFLSTKSLIFVSKHDNLPVHPHPQFLLAMLTLGAPLFLFS